MSQAAEEGAGGEEEAARVEPCWRRVAVFGLVYSPYHCAGGCHHVWVLSKSCTVQLAAMAGCVAWVDLCD